MKKLTTNEIEAANRAEAIALLIRAGYRVYRPEADCYGEDLVLRAPDQELRAVQLKGRPTVDWNRYGKEKSIWMLFPDPKSSAATQRRWFLVPHNEFYKWLKARHGHAPKWDGKWHEKKISKELGEFLEEFML
jgi:hypothetical protein